MKGFKKILKWLFYILLLPLLYVLVSLILSSIVVNKNQKNEKLIRNVYLSTNGVHIDIIIPKSSISKKLLKDLKFDHKTKYLSFGWGDENFYLNTPTWEYLTFSNTFKAIFFKSSTLIHISSYQQRKRDWVKVKLSVSQLNKLNSGILDAFQGNINGSKIILNNRGYTHNDDFYKANGSYSLFNTCNTWANSILKESGIKACYWTPFDFSLLNKHKQ